MAFIGRLLSKIFGNRIVQNIILWAVLAYMVLDLNYNNEKESHYGIIYSPWYYPFIIIGFMIQATLVYINNLWLAPAYLRTKQYLKYFIFVGVLLIVVSAVYTYGVKIAGAHFNVDHTQQAGFVSSPVSKSWSLSALWTDMQTYLVGNAFWLLVFTMAWYTRDYSRQQRIIEQAHKKQAETELNFLKSQINPHFLFNTLNNLYGLALKHSDKAPDAILKLSSILRYLLYESNVDKVPFEKEKEIMQAYIELELLRITDTNGLQFSITADRNDYTIPPLLWLPVLENVFKHGTRIITDDMKACFEFAIRNGVVYIASGNNYKSSVQINGSNKEGGIGLTNLRKRLELLYPGKYDINQRKDETEYAIDVKITL